VVQINFPHRNLKVNALCDTGAAISACSESLIQKILPQYKTSLVRTSKTFTSADSKTIRPIGSTSLGFQLGKHWVSAHVYVFKNLNHQFILGRPFLNENEAILDFGTKNISIKPTKLHATQNYEIKPKSVCIVTGKITNKHDHTHFSTGLVGKVEPLLDEPGVIESIISISNNTDPWIEGIH
jgi:hypothetical protein